jgi:hypothetical protein
MRTIYILLLPASIFLAIYGCIDNPVNNSVKSVSGRVVNYYGFPCFNYKVAASFISYDITDMNGRFNLNDANRPYSLNICDGNCSNIILFDELRNNHTELTNLDAPSLYYNQTHLYVTFPELKRGKKAFIKFISDVFFRSGDAYGYENNSSCNLLVRFLPDCQTIEGKILYFEVTRNNGIISYDCYGIKNITISQNGYNKVNFTADDISYNPPETDISISAVLPNGMNPYDRRVYLSFNSNKNAELYLGAAGQKFKIPFFPSINYKIKVVNYCNGIGNSEKWVYLNPGENAVIVHNTPPQIVYPQDGEANVDNNTAFVISDNSEPGIYEYFFYSLKIKYPFYFYTNKKKFKFSELTSEFFSLVPDDTCQWRVKKYAGFQNMDEFVSVPIIMNSKNVSIELSDHKRFFTAP